MQVSVIGSGVIGLTVGYTLAQAGYKVTIIHSPNDPNFTSTKAGAHWRSFADDDVKLQKLDRISLDVFMQLSNNPASSVKIIQGYEVFDRKPKDWKDPWFNQILPGYGSFVSQKYEFGIQYKTIALSPPMYLTWLKSEFLKLGGKFIAKTVSHIDECRLDHSSIVINCSGIGARTLGGVLDCSMYPTRGHIVLVHAPEIKYTITKMDGDVTYIIPRGDGTVVLGGTREDHAYSLVPERSTTNRILESCIALEPRLADSKILDVWTGLRPSRIGGVRIEKEMRDGYSIMHCYGHGGFGFQSSWGSAMEVLELVRKEVKARL